MININTAFATVLAVMFFIAILLAIALLPRIYWIVSEWAEERVDEWKYFIKNLKKGDR